MLVAYLDLAIGGLQDFGVVYAIYVARFVLEFAVAHVGVVGFHRL